MNRREEPMSNRARKKNTKLVRAAIETEESTPRPRNTRGQSPAKKSRKTAVQTASRLKKTLTSLKIKRKKILSAHSKRTSPGSVEGGTSSPAMPHREGGRWIQTIEKQTLMRTKRLNKKLGKIRSK
jgi:hypothetical protein